MTMLTDSSLYEISILLLLLLLLQSYYSLVSSITQASRAMQSSENTLLIVIQKIIGVTAPEDPLLTHVLCTTTTTTSAANAYAANADAANAASNANVGGDGDSNGSTARASADRGVAHCSKRRYSTVEMKSQAQGHSQGHSQGLGGRKPHLPPCSPVYHYPSSCVGVLLASYMLRHYLGAARDPAGGGGAWGAWGAWGGNSNHFMLQDMTALLSWIETLLAKCADLSVVYALDVLSEVAANLQLT